MSLPEAASQSLAVLIRACRQNPSAVRTERCVVDLILMVKGGDSLPEAASQSLAL